MVSLPRGGTAEGAFAPKPGVLFLPYVCLPRGARARATLLPKKKLFMGALACVSLCLPVSTVFEPSKTFIPEEERHNLVTAYNKRLMDDRQPGHAVSAPARRRSPAQQQRSSALAASSRRSRSSCQAGHGQQTLHMELSDLIQLTSCTEQSCCSISVLVSGSCDSTVQTSASLRLGGPQMAAARRWTDWEMRTSYLVLNQARVDQGDDKFALVRPRCTPKAYLGKRGGGVGARPFLALLPLPSCFCFPLSSNPS